MRQMAMVGDPQFLPQEILTHILKRLPVKSLIRCQCVCKYWKNLIKSPSFIADHFDHSSNRNPSLLLHWNARFDPLHLHTLDSNMRVLQVQPPPLMDPPIFWGRIVGTSNGLLCLIFRSEGISPPSLLLWNPAIREVREVPKPINDFDRLSLLGFGFSPIVNDFKIVISHEREFDKLDNRAEVYSLRTGSWKEIQVENFGGVGLKHKTVYANVNGAMFWFGSKQGSDVIVSFDIALEVFTLIPMPAFDSYSYGRLAVYENKLAIFSRTEVENSESSLINLWVMEQSTSAFRERWNWIKKYTIPNTSGMLLPYGIWGNEIVCNVQSDHFIDRYFIDESECEANDGVVTVLSLLNLSTHELEDFATHRCGFRVSVTLNYAESLVPVLNHYIEEP